MRRLFAFDLDGTIAGSDRRIPAETLASVDELRERGDVVAFVTGRRQVDMLPVLDQVPHADYIGLNNGAFVFRPGKETNPLIHNYVPVDDARVLIAECLDADLTLDVITSDEWYANHITEGDRAYGEKIGHMPVVFSQLNEIDVEHVEGFMIAHIVDEVRGIISKHNLELQCVESEPRCADVMHRCAGKLAALELICREEGMELCDVVAVGNYTNDIEMLEAAGIGVAVADALPEVCAAADMVLTARHNENPVAELLECIPVARVP